MEVWEMIFLLKRVIFNFYVGFRGRSHNPSEQLKLVMTRPQSLEKNETMNCHKKGCMHSGYTFRCQLCSFAVAKHFFVWQKTVA